MSSPSAETLQTYPQRYLDAWNQRDIATALEVVSPKVHWTDPVAPAPMTDHDAVSQFFGGAWLGFPDLHFALVGDPLVDVAGGRVAASWRMTGTHTGEFPPGAPISGNSFEVPGTDVWEVDAAGRATGARGLLRLAHAVARPRRGLTVRMWARAPQRSS